MIVRAGLYGTGAFATFLALTLRNSSTLSIRAVASRDLDRARAFSQTQSIQTAYGSFEAMLDDDDLDAIVIASPPADHAPRALQAVRAAKHVLVEKPLATELEDAADVIAAADEAKRIVAVNYPMPYTDVVTAIGAIARWATASALRRIDVQNVASCSGLGDDHWFWDPRMSGGIFVEHGVHFFDWCGSLLGPPQSAIAWAAQSGARQDRVFAAIGHEGGALATYYHAFIATPQTERTRVDIAFDGCDLTAQGWIPTRLTVRGAVAKDAADVVRKLRRPALRESRLDDAVVFDAGPKQRVYSKGILALADDFAAAISSRAHAMTVDPRRGFESLRVAVAAREAARVGRSQVL